MAKEVGGEPSIALPSRSTDTIDGLMGNGTPGISCLEVFSVIIHRRYNSPKVFFSILLIKGITARKS
jgi:hypothetical protein